MNDGILIVEDNATLAKNMATYLRQHGYRAQTAADAPQAFLLMSSFHPRVVLVDYGLPGLNGLDVLRRLRLERPHVKTVMITGQGSTEIAVEAMKSGACDYLSKPLALADVKRIVDRVVKDEPREPVRPALVDRTASRLDALLGQSPQVQVIKAAVGRLLDAEYSLKDGDRPAVLITGETGTGKELVARAIHHDGPAGTGPFVELNCAAMPATLIESELFGHERGAFTDARAAKPGLVEAAHRGTLFLDEIGELDLAVQSKLLRLIEDKSVRRLGAVREQRAQVRIIAATNQELEKRIGDGLFRADLFFRLRIVHLHMPPLRERGSDVLLLARHFLQEHAERYGKPVPSLTAAAEQALLDHTWPGNVRELRNRLEQTVLMATGRYIGPDELGLPGPGAPGAGVPAGRPAAAQGLAPIPGSTGTSAGAPSLPEQGVVLEQFERSLVQQALQRTHWNVTRAARLLGLSRDTLRYRMEKFELRPPG